MADIELDQINLVVPDMDGAAAFYEALGLRPSAGMSEWAPHHREVEPRAGTHLDLDSTRFAAEWGGLEGDRPRVVIGFRVATREAVDALYAKLTAAGHPGLKPPYDAFWGARYALVQDPAGNPVGLMSPAEADRRRPPPKPPA